ncbi:uncharacterized protein NPIL_420161 [Nephila pilipes]|uniref:Uncharacterized protein n=1 Tax=Nephila pilipes TaxID=299642 RepID=A0A8X6IUG6_NEPPI|nr:uncharacterized protein NPIL_420161 [Nephila pilipes]
MLERELKQLLRVHIPDSNPEGLKALDALALLVERINQLVDQHGRITLTGPPVSDAAAIATTFVHEEKAKNIIDDYIRMYYIYKLELVRAEEEHHRDNQLISLLLRESKDLEQKIAQEKALDENERQITFILMLSEHDERCPFFPLAEQELERQKEMKAAIPEQIRNLEEAEERCRLDVDGVAQWVDLFPATFEHVLTQFINNYAFTPGQPLSEEDEKVLGTELTHSLWMAYQQRELEFLRLNRVIGNLETEKRIKDEEFRVSKETLDAYEAEIENLREQKKNYMIASNNMFNRIQEIYAEMIPIEDQIDSLSKTLDERSIKRHSLGLGRVPSSLAAYQPAGSPLISSVPIGTSSTVSPQTTIPLRVSPQATSPLIEFSPVVVSPRLSPKAISPLRVSQPIVVSPRLSREAISPLRISSPILVSPRVPPQATSPLRISSPVLVSPRVSPQATSPLRVSSPVLVSPRLSPDAIRPLRVSPPVVISPRASPQATERSIVAPSTRGISRLVAPGGRLGIAPLRGRTGIAPPKGRTGIAPPSGRTGIAPRRGRPGIAPPSSSTAIAPLVKSSLRLSPQSTGISLSPKSEITVLPPPDTGYTGIVPRRGRTGIAPPSGRPGIAPPSGRTGIARRGLPGIAETRTSPPAATDQTGIVSTVTGLTAIAPPIKGRIGIARSTRGRSGIAAPAVGRSGITAPTAVRTGIIAPAKRRSSTTAPTIDHSGITEQAAGRSGIASSAARRSGLPQRGRRITQFK